MRSRQLRLEQLECRRLPAVFPLVVKVPNSRSTVGSDFSVTPFLRANDFIVTLSNSDGLRRTPQEREYNNGSGPRSPLFGFLANLYEARPLISETVKMWNGEPLPLIAPPSPAPEQRPPIDQLPPPANEADLPPLPAVMLDRSRPAWLEPTVPLVNGESLSGTAPAAEHQPTEEEREVALAFGLWVGAQTLMLNLPERTPDDEARIELDPSPDPKTPEDGD